MPLKTVQKGAAPALEHFPYISGINHVKQKSDLFADRDSVEVETLTFLYIREGRFVWEVNEKKAVLLTRDLLFLKPGDRFSATESRLEQGTYQVLHLWGNTLEEFLNTFSKLESTDRLLVRQLFDLKEPMIIQDFRPGTEIFDGLFDELESHEVGFRTRVISLIDQLMIFCARALSKQEMNPHDFPKVFMKLDKMLRENLAHPWTVNEMAGIVGLKVTAFTEKIKFFTGFAPLQYLINLRVAEAMRLIRNTDHSLTIIALETGFYSSQHFSSTFKKLTGTSPKTFRENG